MGEVMKRRGFLGRLGALALVPIATKVVPVEPAKAAADVALTRSVSGTISESAYWNRVLTTEERVAIWQGCSTWVDSTNGRVYQRVLIGNEFRWINRDDVEFPYA